MGNWSKRAQEILESSDFEQRVADLAQAAGMAGDNKQVELCEIALGCGVGVSASDEQIRKAREECARALWDGER